jgi:hypothetical protein
VAWQTAKLGLTAMAWRIGERIVGEMEVEDEGIMVILKRI